MLVRPRALHRHDAGSTQWQARGRRRAPCSDRRRFSLLRAYCWRAHFTWRSCRP